MPYSVQISHVPPLPILVVRRRAHQSELSKVVPEGCGAVWNYIRSHPIPHTGRNLAVYFDDVINLECGVILRQPCETDDSVVCTTTPTGRVATVIHLGPYHRLGEANQAILDWCSAHSCKRKGPSWEIYDHWTDDETKLRTDVFYLLEDE
jgi:effector-binding domain-containing protein